MIARSDLVLWLALLAGFSPVLVQFVRFEAHAYPASTFVAPILIAICLWRGTATAEQPRRAGLTLIAAGLLLEVLGIALSIWTLAWLGLPVAVVGAALWLGRPSWRVAVLAFGLVPIPVSLQVPFTPAAESAVLSAACAAWRTAGVRVSCIGPVAHLGDRHLKLGPEDVGWTLAAVLAQLGWFVAVCGGASGRRALRSALVFAAAALVLEPLAVALALGLLAGISEQAARAWLSPGVWLACTVAALVWSRRAGSAPELA